MKFAKIFFASFLLLAITSAFVTPKSHVKRTSYTKYFEYTQSGTPFTITTGTDSRLQTTGNWSQPGSAPTNCGFSSGQICFFTITYTCTPNDDCPSDQELLDALATRFTESLPSSGAFAFDTGSSSVITINSVGPNGGVTVTFTLTQKG